MTHSFIALVFATTLAYMMRRRWDLFVKKWLLGLEPPKEHDFAR